MIHTQHVQSGRGFQKGFQGVSLRGFTEGFQGVSDFPLEIMCLYQIPQLRGKTLPTLIQTNETYESTHF